MNHVLTSERLGLRPVTAEEHEVLFAHWTDPRVRQFLFDGGVLAASEITEAIDGSVRGFASEGYGIWVVRLRESGEAIGVAGLRPLEELGLEVFYSLNPHVWGRGLATEAARAVVDYGLDVLGLPRVLAEVDEGNTGSIAVVERLGMTPFAVVPGVLGPMIRYRVSR
ncbi:GNAT family N-acetyltransferase [Nocardia sp. NPDC127526]|uniref:GNAT family N-acetyltransferase n=1 Tax=Nocardia sp. NPDC127526 TaxID=3345393 RepID=UPI003624D2DB